MFPVRISPQAGFAPFDETDLRRLRQCPRWFWLQRLHPELAAAPDGVPPAETGDPGIVAASEPDAALLGSHPGALVVPAPTDIEGFAAAAALTATLMTRVPPRPILGACFESPEGVRVRAELLLPEASYKAGLSWVPVMVRYATVSHDIDLDVAALRAHVLAQGGTRVPGIGLVHINTEFVYPGYSMYAGLFRDVDVSAAHAQRRPQDWLEQARALLAGAEPDIAPGSQCQRPRRCPYHARCAAPSAQPEPGHSLEILGRELAEALRAEGYADVLAVPAERLPDERRRRMQRAVRHNRAILDGDLRATRAGWGWPRRLLRFETIGFAVPVWPGTQPYQVLPFQWSCAQQAAPGHNVISQYLADQRGDPRGEFTASLLDVLGDDGPIFAYNAGFERNRIRELAVLFPAHAQALEALLERIVDLFQVVRAHYYHPQMAGSWSARAVFAAVAPELDCEHLTLPAHFPQPPQTPLEAFAASLRPDLADGERRALRHALLAHGERQLVAMQRIVEIVEGLQPI